VALQASALRWLAQLQDDGTIERHFVVRLKVLLFVTCSCLAITASRVVQASAASAFSQSFPLQSLSSDHVATGASYVDGRIGNLARMPSMDRLRALSVCEEEEWAKGVTFADWYNLIQRSFEHRFWIPEDKAQDASYDIGAATPWVRGMYKDCLGCHDEWCTFQLRPNQAIAMAVAPFLFDPAHARVSLLAFQLQQRYV